MVVVVVVILEQTRRNAWENRANLRYSIVLCKTHCNFLAPMCACSPTFRGDHEHTTINAVTTLVLEVIVLLSHPK
jgi:hypothetical protein